jgi:hypothetical protein
MRTAIILRLSLCIVLACLHPAIHAQTRRSSSTPPRIEVQSYKVAVSLMPETHELQAEATIEFLPLEETDRAVFELSENLSVQRILNTAGVEIDFGQDESGPGLLTVHFSKPLTAGELTTIRVQYNGGFDRDRYSRFYARDENSAYIGMEGSYLLYQSKWFPINRYLGDRAAAELKVTVPLGITAIGPGTQLPVITKGITETFGWSAKSPILPNSIVAGQYFQKRVEAQGFTIDCFARENNIEAIQKKGEIVAAILEYYTQTYGLSLPGRNFRLVEVDDRLASEPGMLGTIFITHRELSETPPTVLRLARKIAYQWWSETVGAQTVQDVWLPEAMSYLSAADYLGHSQGEAAFKEEIANLAILALKFETKSAVRDGYSLGYRTETFESVAAGKGAWVLYMLRKMMGEDKYRQLVGEYMGEFTAKGGTTAGFRKLAEQLYGKELGWFFAEWVDTTGVPTLETDYVVFKTENGFRVSGTVKQDRDLFKMPLEISVITHDKEEMVAIDLDGKSTSFDLDTFSAPGQVILDPGNKILRDSKELQTSVQLSLGNDLKQKGNFVEAVKAYENAIKLNPRSSLAHFRLAEVFWEQFNLQSAANSFRDALNGDKNPKWVEVWCYIYLGKVYDILGQRQRALAEYNRAQNTKDDYNGAQDEAKKWLAEPFTRERTTMEKESPD